ncbi:ANP2 [Symbiodinium necroappetens]|uniref:ANP2 protein n=1 Tax=Symbiodinium necroappetens TaxID=1628268 RepID=A0A813ALM5_9DINO|nr:ANP2 [Symbiodinium necroappetens]
MASDWPLQYANMRQTYRELTDVCAGRPLDFTDTPEEPLDVPGTNPEVLSTASADFSFECSDPASCITNVVKYESDNPGAEWGMKAGKFATRFTSVLFKEILKAAGKIALKGVLAFTFIGGAISAFFPGAGGLPVNPCTFAETEDWGRCVWEQVKPFVQEFVEDQLDDTFGDLWDATINGYKTRLWALNATVYHNSKLYPNGTIEEMSNATRDRMYEDLKAVHDAMLGSIRLFLTDRAIKTTAGAYLSQFASLHYSVITNLLGSLKYRTAGDRYVFQTVVACYARRVYERATAAFKSRMSVLEAHEEDQGIRKCCMVDNYKCEECHIGFGEFKDTWKPSCGWKTGYHTVCMVNVCQFVPGLFARRMARDCYQRHREEVANQTVQFWQNWLSPLPTWLAWDPSRLSAASASSGSAYAQQSSSPSKTPVSAWPPQAQATGANGALRSSRGLQVLELAASSVDAAVPELGLYLASQCCTLTELDLSWNTLGPNAVHQLSWHLRQNVTLRTLRLAHCHLKEAAGVLCACLATTGSHLPLQRLDLARNAMPTAAFEELAIFLGSVVGRQITDLDISGNSAVSDAGVPNDASVRRDALEKLCEQF